MTNAYIVTGTLADASTVKLDEPLPVSAGRVRVVVEAAVPAGTGETLSEWLRRVWADQNRRGHVPPTVEEVEARIREERDWGDR